MANFNHESLVIFDKVSPAHKDISWEGKNMPKLSLAIAAAAICAPGLAASAAPPNVVYTFQVMTETLLSTHEAPTAGVCITEPQQFNCTAAPGKAPYLFATLTVTHDALTSHEAQWAGGSGEVPSPTFPPANIPDDNIVSFQLYPTVPGYPEGNWMKSTTPCCAGSPLSGCTPHLGLPPYSTAVRAGDGTCAPNYFWPEHFSVSFQIVGKQLSGSVAMGDQNGHGGCSLSMQGTA